MKSSKHAGYALLTALLVSVAGCGGGSTEVAAAPTAVAPAAVAPAVRDAFVSSVQTTTNNSSDEAEAFVLGAMVATTPEDTEPMNL